MTNEDPMTDEKLVETFARMWMECDPNRGGSDPDETITMHSPEREVPHWHWFIPRAAASLRFLAEKGISLRFAVEGQG